MCERAWSQTTPPMAQRRRRDGGRMLRPTSRYCRTVISTGISFLSLVPVNPSRPALTSVDPSSLQMLLSVDGVWRERLND